MASAFGIDGMEAALLHNNRGVVCDYLAREYPTSEDMVEQVFLLLVHLHAYVHICMHVYMRVYVHVHVLACMSKCVHVHVHVRGYVCAHASVLSMSPCISCACLPAYHVYLHILCGMST